MIIVDTNVISELQKAEPNPNVIAWLDRQEPTNLYLTSITVAELMFGAFLVPPGRRARLERKVARRAQDGRVFIIARIFDCPFRWH